LDGEQFCFDVKSEQGQLIILVLRVGAGLFLFHAFAQEVVGGVVGLEAFENGFGAVDDCGGQAGEAGDLDAVGARFALLYQRYIKR